MIWAGFLAVFLLTYSPVFCQNGSDGEIPFVIAGAPEAEQISTSTTSENDEQAFTSQQVPVLAQLPTNRGRSDIEIESDSGISGGYFYPKPSKSFDLPPFKTLDAKLPFDGISEFRSSEGSGELERSPRSPQRPTFFYPPPNYPPNRPNWGYPPVRPNPPVRPYPPVRPPIRPLPAPWGGSSLKI